MNCNNVTQIVPIENPDQFLVISKYADIIAFKTSCSDLKITGLGKTCVRLFSIYGSF